MRAFVIAMRKEAEAIRPALGPGDRLYVSGIGKVNAAAATMKAICEGATEIWNAGLAGGFGADLAVGDIWGVEDACEYDFDLASINGVSVGVLDGFDSPYIRLAKIPALTTGAFPWFKGWKTLATGDRFNDREDDTELIEQVLKAGLRDMEGAAIAHVCKQEGVRCSSLKCVSDVHGAGGMTGQYLENAERCLGILGTAMRELLAKEEVGE